MSGGDTFSEQNGNDFLPGSSLIEARCLLMCPESESLWREQNQLLHVCEQLNPPSAAQTNDGSTKINLKDKKAVAFKRADRRRMVKAYRRPAAGQKENDPEILRPPPVLRKTVLYLVENVAKDTCFDWNARYGFVCDRLRAVRQDLIIQQLSAVDIVDILEPMIPFYVNSQFRCESNYRPCSSYDAKLHEDQFQECLTRLKFAYDHLSSDSQHENSSSPHSHLKDIVLCVDLMRRCVQDDATVWNDYLRWFSTLRNYGLAGKTRREPLEQTMERISISGETLEFSVNNDFCESFVDNSKMLKMVGKLLLAVKMGNYIGFFRNLETLPPLLRAAAWFLVPRMRKHAMKAMAVAYKPKNVIIPTDVVKKWLCFDDGDDVAICCEDFGLVVNTTAGVQFTFREDYVKTSTLCDSEWGKYYSLLQGIWSDY